jgi:hypothetical protein
MSAIETHKMGTDLGTLLHVHRIRDLAPIPNWYAPILISVVITFTLPHIATFLPLLRVKHKEMQICDKATESHKQPN